MAQKLWEKNVQVDRDIEKFTVGKDREMDLFLARYDILGSIAHISMLESIGLLTRDELDRLVESFAGYMPSPKKENSSSKMESKTYIPKSNSC